MMKSLAITIMGKNQPGLINTVSQLAADCDANWVESHLAEMVGQFAGIIHLEVPANHVERLTQELTDLGTQGLSVTVGHSVAEVSVPNSRTLTLELVGQDQPGIVRDISKVLAESQVSIEALQTQCESGSMAGGLIFSATATLSVPATVSTEALDTLLQGWT